VSEPWEKFLEDESIDDDPVLHKLVDVADTLHILSLMEDYDIPEDAQAPEVVPEETQETKAGEDLATESATTHPEPAPTEETTAPPSIEAQYHQHLVTLADELPKAIRLRQMVLARQLAELEAETRERKSTKRPKKNQEH
jgi:hypothetical protein